MKTRLIFKRTIRRATTVGMIAVFLAPPLSSGQELSVDERIRLIEQNMSAMQAELQKLKQERDAERQRAETAEQKLQEVEEIQSAMLAEMEEGQNAATQVLEEGPSLPAGLQVGAYGEHHFNIGLGDGIDSQSDIHRFVFFLGYEFTDWISFVSETELEHAFVDSDDGELILEQFYFDFNFDPSFNVRLGRVLHPAGIINRFHEPTTFFGVERPTYAVNILPSTWSVDGIGAWGQITDWLGYEAYFHTGLDGSGFAQASGIRGGRLKERPGLLDFGVSGRVDVQPLIAANVQAPVDWRVGGSYSYVGTDDADQGRDNTPNDGDGVHIFAFDTDLAWQDWEFRGEIAYLDLIGSGELPASGIFGFYTQLAYWFLPDSWKTGRLKNADAAAFVRFDYASPQFTTAGNVPRDPTDNTREVVFGASFYPVENLVLKADYAARWAEDQGLPDRIDLGVGYDF